MIGISEHVDYWNGLGWVDPFSSSVYSERQRAYGRSAGRWDTYTPQMVVAGVDAFVGSDRGEARKAIRDAAKRPQASIRLAITDAFEIEVIVADLPPSKRNRRYDLMLALVEDGLQVAVPQGENAGQNLRHDGVARRIKRIATLRPDVTTTTVRHTVRPDPEWNQQALRVVVFLQSRQDLSVIGAAAVPLGSRTIAPPRSVATH